MNPTNIKEPWGDYRISQAYWWICNQGTRLKSCLLPDEEFVTLSANPLISPAG